MTSTLATVLKEERVNSRLSIILTRAMDWLVDGCLVIACATALFVALFGTADVASTYFFNQPLPIARELPEELLVIIIFMALPRVMRDDRNVAVDLVMEQASPRLQRMARILALFTCTLVFAFLAWRSFDAAVDSFSIRETVAAVYRFPVWPIKILMCFALVVTTLESLRLTVRTLVESEPASADENQPLNTGF